MTAIPPRYEARCPTCGALVSDPSSTASHVCYQPSMTASPLGDSPRQQQRELPRRNYTDLFVPAEKAIWDATQAVEETGAHPYLTDAVVLLAQAREKVADWVDGVPLGEPAPVSASPETEDPTTERLEEATDAQMLAWLYEPKSEPEKRRRGVAIAARLVTRAAENAILTLQVADLQQRVRDTEANWAEQDERLCGVIGDLQQQNAALTAERLMLAKLAARTPQFYNPLDVMEAERLRDTLLLSRGEEKPA